ncbi:phosphotransferase family protein [Kribbella shirazensis]|uniref:Aminoglycoside phosphotransferase (APT) family kinase protein n=1 Tax=Kribbella shirazensis TaxID=1105143 RepID=A0A7X5V5U9_9ACTN|nr:aminoglycoside phosphotransferase family protein [Kribbella shirazensis]NIK54532.1 aminoglycoside phosphotransferase (APT) family kinase protein [Kribbella shirazensis]
MGEQHDVLDQVTEIARRHGVDPAEVKEVAGGVANRGFVLGEKLFLRVCRPGFEADLLKETHVVPAARSVGVLTPAIIQYDDTRRLADSPYVVTERVHGTEPTDLPPRLAEQLACLHQLDLHNEPPARATGTDGAPVAAGAAGAAPVVPEDDWSDPWRTVDELGSRGYLDPGTADWLTGWFTRLADRIDRSRPKVLIHGDVAAHNLLVDPANNLRALIDWGDAAWAPRAMDFAKLPLTQVAVLLPDYVRHSQTSDSEQDLAAATLWFHLHWALARIPSTPDPNQRHWTAPTASRLINLLHFFTTSPPAPWTGLT